MSTGLSLRHSLWMVGRLVRCSRPFARVALGCGSLTGRPRQMAGLSNFSAKVAASRTQPFEEEQLLTYRPEHFYPVKLGEELNSRYRVVVKLGFGTASTVWLCRDLKTEKYVTTKVCTVESPSVKSELAVSSFFKSVQVEHPGIQNIRLLFDDFLVQGPHGAHRCLVYPPLGMTLTEFRNRLPSRMFSKPLLQQTLLLVSLGLDLLHQAGIVHTDLSPNNILLGVQDTAIFSQLEEDEIKKPVPRKILTDRIIYGSRPMPLTTGMPVICDFGSCRIGEPGQKYRGDVMPDFYRAPEVVLGMEWDEKIDVWCIGLMLWDLFQGKRLFFALKDKVLNDEQHLAEMVALMGPPPKAFLARSESCRRYWDSEGNWLADTPIPDESFITRESNLEGEDHRLFVALAQKIFRWLPEERPTAQDLTEDDFIAQPQTQRLSVASLPGRAPSLSTQA